MRDRFQRGKCLKPKKLFLNLLRQLMREFVELAKKRFIILLMLKLNSKFISDLNNFELFTGDCNVMIIVYKI